MLEAKISKKSISITIPISKLQQVVEGAWALNALEVRQKITDANMFADALVGALNSEDEQGTNMIHKMFDGAINEALEQGAEGIEDHKNQDA